MINTTRLVKEIFEDIIETGGSTRMIDGTPAMLGYAVGGYATALQIKLDTPSDVIGEVSKWIDNTPLLTLDGYYVGAWIDSETNILWLDATRVHPPCSEAKRAAAMLGSQARGSDAWPTGDFDVGNKREIRIAAIPAGPGAQSTEVVCKTA